MQHERTGTKRVPSALVTMSHSPLMGFTEPAPRVRSRVNAALGGARAFIADFDPELVVLFGPDHYNGFFYDMMPSFCIGAAAESIGDYDTSAGTLPVDHDAALAFVRDRAGRRDRRDPVRADVRRPRVRAAAGGAVRRPGPGPGGAGLHQLRGAAAGAGAARAPARRGDRLGGGWPGPAGAVPRLGRPIARPAGADPGGRGAGGRRPADLRGPPPHPGAAGRPAGPRDPGGTRLRGRRSRPCSRSTPNGTAICWPSSPPATLEQIDGWTTDWFTKQAGHSAHETRTSIAAYAALAAAGPYSVTASFYEPIPDWIAGFAVTTAVPAAQPA